MHKRKFVQLIKPMKTTKKIWNTIYTLVFIFLVAVAGLTALSAANIPGNYKLLVVQSGSMEPAIKQMSIVVVKPEPIYKVGDVITVTDPSNPKISITHRIVQVENNDYITKGDANKDPDLEKRPKKSVLGRVWFTVPFIGYPVAFSKTREGLIILIVIPATIIIYSELLSIKNETIKLLKKRKKKLSASQKLEMEIGEKEILTERWFHKLWKKFKE